MRLFVFFFTPVCDEYQTRYIPAHANIANITSEAATGTTESTPARTKPLANQKFPRQMR